MREIVIVITDLYLPPATQEPSSPRTGQELPSARELRARKGPAAAQDANAIPGVEYVTRFGAREVLAIGWRDWLARWVGREDLVGMPAAVIAAAAAGIGPRGEQSATAAVAHDTATAWIATPVSMFAGLATVHLDHRSILRPPQAELARLAADFQSVFHDSGFFLQPLTSGDFLMLGPSIPESATTEPARGVVAGVSESLPSGAGASALRRLSAEIEMWLHGHPENEIRMRRGEPPVTALWLWGGGAMLPATASRAATALPSATGSPLSAASPPATALATSHALQLDRTDVAFGSDAFLAGLWHLHSGERPASAEQLHELFSYPPARRATALAGIRRAVVVTELAEMLHSHSHWTALDALAEIDRRWLTPALQVLRSGQVERLVLIANDRQFTLRARDRFKFWRRHRRGLEGLQ